jgi:NAD(P)-dependent dehydrogenase (short-subunit alcohol dehydrogenase family)
MAELVLITGCSSGIGLSAALECAHAGFRVVATMRNLERRDELAAAAKARDLSIAVEQLDVTSTSAPGKIRELVLKYGPFFGLVNNAGIAFGGAFEEQTDEDVREQFETNVFGLMAITRAVLPSMRAQRRGRVVNVSSLSGRVGLPGVSAYAATKHAVEGFSEALRWEVEPFGVQVCLVEPGTFKTPIFAANQRRASLADMDGPYGKLNRMLERVAEEASSKGAAPDAVGRAIAGLLAASSPTFRTIVGHDARALVALRQLVPDRLFATGVRLFQSRSQREGGAPAPKRGSRISER